MSRKLDVIFTAALVTLLIVALGVQAYALEEMKSYSCFNKTMLPRLHIDLQRRISSLMRHLKP